MAQEIERTRSAQSAASAQLVAVGQLRRQLQDLMRIDDYEMLDSPDAVIAFRGQIHGDTEIAFEQMTKRFADYGYTALLRDRPDGGHEVIATKGIQERKAGRVWVNLALFLATVLTTLFIGTGYALQDAGMVEAPDSVSALLPFIISNLWRGIPFAATLLGILVAHELSHYFVARRYGSPVSLPYFIPMPASIMGTMGAVIVQRAPMRNRKALFDIGIAGPLGGLIVCLPLLVLGLSLSEVGPPPPGIEVAWQEGNSLLYVALKYLVFGRFLPSEGVDVWLHPVAFAAWAGLLVTMINLIPVGQLDGGHVSYALLGRRAWTLGYVLIGGMFVLGGWLLAGGNQAGGFWILWGLLNLILNRQHPPPLDDATKLSGLRIAVGILMLVIFILTFTPAPLQEVVLG